MKEQKKSKQNQNQPESEVQKFKATVVHDYIFQQPKRQKPKYEPDTIKEHRVVGYAYDGHGKEKTIDPTHYLAWAKVVHSNGRQKYHIKICKSGSNIGLLPNPKRLNFDTMETSRQLNGMPMYLWQVVKKDIFDDYLKFLTSGDTRWVRSAQSKLQS